MTWTPVKELPVPVQAALAGVSYGRADIEVKATEKVVMSSAGCDGRRAFVTMVNLTTGERHTEQGSWGGANMFNPGNPVDLDNGAYPLPENGAVVLGTVGYPRTFATVYVHPTFWGKVLPAAKPAVSAEELNALYAFGCIKGGEYRRDELRRRNVSNATVDNLVSRGFLKENRAGARQITTAGRNALGNYRGF